MGIITKMRNQMQIVMWTILILFVTSMAIGGLVGGASVNDIFNGNQSGTQIGSLNNKPIFLDDFNALVSSEINRTAGKNKNSLSDEQVEYIKAIVWERLINDLLIQEQIEANKITVGDSEILFQMQNNPPPFLRSNDSFKTNGNFDLEKYLNAVLSPGLVDWKPVEDFMKEVYLPNYKLQQYILHSAHINPEDILNDFKKKFVEYDLEILHITENSVDNEFFNSMTNGRPTDLEINNLYVKNKSKYEQSEKRYLKYVRWPIEPSKNDSLRVEILAKDLFFRAKNGDDFANLANQYTDDPANNLNPSSPKGGNLGWFSKDQFIPEFSNAAFEANKGDIVGPILTNYGYHLIKINDIKKDAKNDKVNASHILLRIKPGKETEDAIQSIANLFSLEASENGFTESAKKENLEIHDSNGIVKQSIFIDEAVGPVRNAVNFAFNSSLESVSDAFKNDNYFFVFYLNKIEEKRTATIQEVREELKEEFLSNLKKEQVKILAESLFKDSSTERNLLQKSKENESFEYIAKDTSSLNGSFKSIGKSSFVVGALMSSEIGDVIGPLPTIRGQAFIRILNKTKINQQNFDEIKESIKFSLLINRQNLIWENWIQALRDESKIKDYRFDIF
jgi:parvulin-like peptidyl-prolyl isomerase